MKSTDGDVGYFEVKFATPDLRVTFSAAPLPILLTTIRYDTRCYFNVRSKVDMSQLNLPRRNQQLKCGKTGKLNSKKGYAQKYR